MKRIVMDKIRKGNDISVEWAIFIDSEGQQAPYDLTGRKLTMYLTNRYGTSQVSDFKTEGNILRWTFYGKDQKHLGNYTLTLVENEGKNYMHTVDVCNAFCLVNHSCETLAGDEDKVKLVYLGFSSEISTGYGGIQIDDALSEESENPVQNKVVTEALKEKVDKVEGKQLSTEDFTPALKTKLEGLSNYDDTQIAKRIQEVEADIPTKVSQLENDRGYLTEHQDISNLASKNDLAKKQDVISDLATIRSGASKGATALQSIPSEYVTETELNAKGYATTSQVNAKQDKISDLDTIREGAKKGATAIQSVKTINGQSIEGEGNITIEGGGSNITVDTELSDTSENPVQNKVIYENLYGMNQQYIQMYEEQNRVFTNAINDVNTELLKKVDYVAGKQLSTEDFTTALKTKLEGLNNYDDTSIQNAVNSLTTQINTLVSGDASVAIESFNEIIAFLNGVEDSESLDSIIAAIEQQIAGKQDKLVSGTNIKTINGESILGEGNIVVNVDTSNLATKEELTSLTNEIIANEEVHAGAYNDLNTRLNELSENVQGETVTKEDFNAAIEGVNNGISAKQDVLVSGTNIKTINNESILGSGNIEINVDTSSLASKEELQNLQNEVIANEEVVAAAFNDVNERINAISENVSGTTVTKEELESAVETINQTISDNKSATDTAIEGLETSIGNVDAKFANYATTESLTTEIANLTNEIIANEEVHAAALNDLNERLNNGGGGSGGSGVVTFYIPSGETATDEEIAKNKAAYDAFIATNGGVYIFVKFAQFTLIPSCFQVDSDLIRIEIMSSVFSEDGSVMSLFFGFASDGSITML